MTNRTQDIIIIGYPVATSWIYLIMDNMGINRLTTAVVVCSMYVAYSIWIILLSIRISNRHKIEIAEIMERRQQEILNAIPEHLRPSKFDIQNKCTCLTGEQMAVCENFRGTEPCTQYYCNKN